MRADRRFALHANSTYIEDENGNREFKISGSVKSAFNEYRQFDSFYVNPTGYVEIQFYTNNGIITYVKKINTFPRFENRHKSTPVSVAVPFELKVEGDNILPDDIMNVQLVVKFDNTQSSNIVNITKGLSLNPESQLKKEELFQKDILKKDYEFQREMILKSQLEKQQIKNQIITIPEIIPDIKPEIIPAVVASSALIPLGIIGLLLYTSRGKK